MRRLPFDVLRRDLRLQNTPTELHNVELIAPAEGLKRLPTDYSELPLPKADGATPSIPVLGDPLPGDLGGPMLRAGVTTQAASPVPNAGDTDPNAEALRAERINQQREIEEAAKAPLFHRARVHAAGGRELQATAVSVAATAPVGIDTPANEPDGTPRLRGDPNVPGADQKHSFLTATPNLVVISTHTLQKPVSPCQVMAGTGISAALLTAINSDLPGTILANVTEPVIDSKLARFLLISQGTRLIGEYDSKVAFGERRVLLAWNRMVFPDGTSLTLDRLPGVDPAGNSGLANGRRSSLGSVIRGRRTIDVDRRRGGARGAQSLRHSSSGHCVSSAECRGHHQPGRAGTYSTQSERAADVNDPARLSVRVIVSKDLVLRPYASLRQPIRDEGPMP